MNALILILGGAIAGAVVTLAAAAAIVRLWPQLLQAAAGSATAPEPPPATAPFSASPPRLADVPSGRHAAAAPQSRPQPSPERDVERTHLMRAVQVAGPIRVDPTRLNEKAIAAALNRAASRQPR